MKQKAAVFFLIFLLVINQASIGYVSAMENQLQEVESQEEQIIQEIEDPVTDGDNQSTDTETISPPSNEDTEIIEPDETQSPPPEDSPNEQANGNESSTGQSPPSDSTDGTDSSPDFDKDEDETVKPEDEDLSVIPQMQLLNDDTTNVQLNHQGAGGMNLYTRDYYTFNVKMDVSSALNDLINHTVVVEINHTNIRNIEVVLPQGQDTGQWTQTKENGKTYIKIPFNKIKGGTSFEFPIKLRAQQGITPEGQETVIHTSLLNEDGEVRLAVEESLSFTTKYDLYSLSKRINGDSADNQNLSGGVLGEDGIFVAGTESIITYDYSITPNAGTNIYGDGYYRSYNKVTITDKLPEGAHFDPDLNPGWTQDGENVIYTLNAPANISGTSSTHNQWILNPFHEIRLHLTFPGSKPNDKFMNQVSAQFHQVDRQEGEPDHILEDTISHTFNTDSFTGFVEKIAGSTVKSNARAKEIRNLIGDKSKNHDWYLMIANPRQFPMKDFVLEDYKHEGSRALDERLRFTKINLNHGNFSDVKAVYKYIDMNGTKVAVAGNNGIYDLGTDAIGYRVEFNTLPKLMAKTPVIVTSVMDNPENVGFDSNNNNNNFFYNTAYVSTDFDTTGTNVTMQPVKDVRIADRFVLVETEEKIRIYKRDQITPTAVGDTVSFWLEVYTGEMDQQRVLQNARIIDLLPLGLDPIVSTDGSYEIVENYENTGRTAYVYNLGTGTVEQIRNANNPSILGNEAKPENERFVITMKAKVNQLAALYRTNDMYFVYDGDQVPIKVPERAKIDEWDLNNNGNTEDLINWHSNTFPYIAAKEVISQKLVGKNDEGRWGTTIDLKEGETYEYSLQVHNFQDRALEELTLYDVLPHIGDTVSVPNQSGEYADRGTEIKNTLNGPVSVSEGFTVYYSTVPAHSVVGDAQANWSSAVTNYADVTMLKIVMNEGVKIEPQKSLQVIIPMKAPDVWESNDKYGVNTYAISVDGGIVYNESNPVYNRIFKEGEQPEITKDVNGQEEISILRNREFNYHLRTKVSEDAANLGSESYGTLTMTDTLDERLQIVGTSVRVNGEIVDDLIANVDGQTVTLVIDREQLIEYAGQEVELQIRTKIDRNAPIEPIENKGEIQLNDNPMIDSNIVIVKPRKPSGGGGGTTDPDPDPEKPVDPDNPDPDPDPEKPVDPDNPGPDPEKPVDPDNPGPDPEKPVDPDNPDPDPEKPVDPDNPGENKPDSDSSGGTKGDSNGDGDNKPAQQGEGEVLPNTATNTFNLLILGIVLLMLGAIVLVYSRASKRV